MKITQIMLSAGFGGAERYFVDLCQALQERGHIVQAVCHSGFIARQDLEKNNAIQLDPFSVMGWWDLYHQAKIRAAIDRFNPDIVHAHLARASYVAGKACSSLHLPLVVKTHNYVKLKYYRNVNHFITTTPDQKKYLMMHQVDESIISVIPNFSSIAVKKVDEYRGDELQFAAYGRLVKKKGMHILLEAFKQFLEAGNRATLHIGGEGPELTNLKALTETLGLQQKVVFHGWINNAADFISRYDIMVLPSLDEPFGIVVLEVMASGKPLIATRTDGPMEILDENSAYMVEPGEVRALNMALVEAAANPEKRTARARTAQTLFTDRYSEAKVVPSIIETYEQVIRRLVTSHPVAGAGSHPPR